MKEKLNVYLPILLSVSMVIGIFIGYRIHRQLPYERDFFDLKPTDKWLEIQQIIQNRYVENVGVDSLVEKNIDLLFSALDPFSKYIPAVKTKDYQEEIEGHFFGIGVQFRMIDDTMNVVAVIENGPAYTAGLETGDKIVRVNGEDIANKKLHSSAIQKYFKGEQGKKLQLLIYRNQAKKDLTVVTGDVPIHSVTSSYMLDNKTGYIKLESFSGNSHAELCKSLETLKTKGMQNLILDLRYNPGGILSEAVDIADEFLEGEKLVTYTSGEHQSRKDYKCKRNGLFEKGKIIVLINDHSASASEVVSGALQDWERAIIIGDTSYGKGLVQEQFSLRDGSNIRLTVAKYYTPLGRHIQKPFTSSQFKPDTFYTASGTQLFSLGGIIPNIVYKEKENTHLSQPFLETLNQEGQHTNIFDNVFRFYCKHKVEIEKNDFTDKIDFSDNIKQALFKDIFRRTKLATNALTNTKDRAFLESEMIRILASYVQNGKHLQMYLNQSDEIVRLALKQLQ